MNELIDNEAVREMEQKTSEWFFWFIFYGAEILIIAVGFYLAYRICRKN